MELIDCHCDPQQTQTGSSVSETNNNKKKKTFICIKKRDQNHKQQIDGPENQRQKILA